MEHVLALLLGMLCAYAGIGIWMKYKKYNPQITELTQTQKTQRNLVLSIVTKPTPFVESHLEKDASPVFLYGDSQKGELEIAFLARKNGIRIITRSPTQLKLELIVPYDLVPEAWAFRSKMIEGVLELALARAQTYHENQVEGSTHA